MADILGQFSVPKLKAGFVKLFPQKVVLNEELQSFTIEEALATVITDADQDYALESTGAYLDLTRVELLEADEVLFAFDTNAQSALPVELTGLTPADIRYWYASYKTYLVSYGEVGFTVWVV